MEGTKFTPVTRISLGNNCPCVEPGAVKVLRYSGREGRTDGRKDGRWVSRWGGGDKLVNEFVRLQIT